MSDKERTCPSCGTAYVEHLGLIGTCAKVQEWKSLANQINTDWIPANKAMAEQNTILREALNRLTIVIQANGCADYVRHTATQALQRAGGTHE